MTTLRIVVGDIDLSTLMVRAIGQGMGYGDNTEYRFALENAEVGVNLIQRDMIVRQRYSEERERTENSGEPSTALEPLNRCVEIIVNDTTGKITGVL